MADHDALIDELAGGAEAVRSRSDRSGRWWLVGVGLATLALVYSTIGFRADVMAGRPTPMLSVTAGLFLLLAAAAGIGAVRMARPQVGARSSGAPWLLSALMLVPLVALTGVVTQPTLLAGLDIHRGLPCLSFGLVAGLGAFAFLAFWLRQGAPVSPERAAWLAGLAAGAVGALALTLECRHEPFAHLAIWHVAAVPLSAVASRLILPRFLRW